MFKKANVAWLFLVFSIFLNGCNSPPLYETRAREILQEEGFSADVINRLIKRETLTSDEVEKLLAIDEIPVLHLLGRNPSLEMEKIIDLSRHPSFEVKTGVATNPKTPLSILLEFRTPGEYTTLNSVLARNPKIPQDTLREMNQNGETSYVDLALNPNTPRDIMLEILEKGTEIDRSWLATNQNLPADIAQRLATDPSKLVRDHYKANHRSQEP